VENHGVYNSYATHIAEDFIVQKVQRGDFENWEAFWKRILMWNSIDALQHEYVRPSEFFNKVKAVVNDSLKTPRKFMLNVNPQSERTIWTRTAR
jgi:hypothetical protein